jgi:hypothetical protein
MTEHMLVHIEPDNVALVLLLRSHANTLPVSNDWRLPLFMAADKVDNATQDFLLEQSERKLRALQNEWAHAVRVYLLSTQAPIATPPHKEAMAA